jgi:hypothetical protein
VIGARSTQSPPRARPVADAATDAALARAEELARRWIVALIRVRPLDAIGDLPLQELAREGPGLCAQILRAMQSASELARLTGRGGSDTRSGVAPASRIPAILGVSEPDAVVQAVEALRGVLWESLIDQLSEPSAREVGDLADRLAYVCAEALAVALADAKPAETDASEAIIDDDAGLLRPATAGTHGISHTAVAGQRAIVVDDLRHEPPAQYSSATTSRGTRAGDIEIRDVRGSDVRGSDGPAAWIGSIGSQLERFERDRLPFAVLLVELVEIERMSRAGRGSDVAGPLDRVEQTLSTVLGAHGSITRERPGRYWLVMADTDRSGARYLAERLARAVAVSGNDPAVGVEVAVGVAVCPEDGREAAALAAHADVGLYADRSAVRAAGGRRSAVEDPV